ncbi:MAG: hypothetical protein CMN31_07445 [Sandaracinus sp.]|nr:hypothetical protein [Sandaracinus sp.]MBJ71160.1 hypothetical protein [Sandaracinus sp.]
MGRRLRPRRLLPRPTVPLPPLHRARAALALWLACLGAAALAAHAGAPPSTVALATAAGFFPYALLAVAERGPGPRLVLAATLLAGLPLAFAPGALSDDLYRYLWDARVAASGVDPYLYAPSAPELAPLRDAVWARVNNPDVPTIYPPVAQAIFRGAALLAHAPWSMKLVAFAAHLGVGFALRRVVDPARRDRAALLWWLNPLALEESALGGHVDVFVGLAVLAFVAALRAGRVLPAVLLAGLASGVKLVGLALAPLVGGRARRAVPFALALATLPVWPLVGAGAGSDAVGGLGQYARRWRGNEGLYALVETGVGRALQAQAGVAEGRVRFESWRPALERLEGTTLDPRASFLPEKKPIWDIAEFETHVLAALIARALVVFAVFALAALLAWRRAPPLEAARAVLLVGLLFAPQVHPWYLLWLLPLEIALGRVTVLAWSAVSLIAYAPLDGWVAAREWVEPGAAPLLQYGLVLGVLAAEEALRWRARSARTPRQSESESRESLPPAPLRDLAP